MMDAKGESITVSRDLHLVSDEGDCIAAKVVAVDDHGGGARGFELVLFPPKAVRHFAKVALSATRWPLNVTLSEGGEQHWHWPRDCKR